MNTPPTAEERTWAAISHLAALGFGMGILLPVVAWSEQRRRSKYASFQSLQALGYQSLGYTVWIISYLLIMIVVIISFATALGTTAQASVRTGTVAGIAAAVLVLAALGLLGPYFLLPMIAAGACALGRDFHYPILGAQLARYLAPRQADGGSALPIEEREDRWVAAMCHFSVVIAVWGLLAPLTAWILQGGRSSFLKFQSIQTTAYQALVSIVYLVAGFACLFGVMGFLLTNGGAGGSQPGSPVSVAGLFLFGVSFLIGSVILLIVPLFHILGQWAGYRLLKGEVYRYPILGRLIDQWGSKNPSIQEKPT